MCAKIKTVSNHTKTSHHGKPRGTSKHTFEKVYWPYIPLVLLAVFLMSLATRNGLLASVIKHPTSSVLGYASGLSPSELLNDTNKQRQSNGAAALELNDALTRAAQAKANDMALRNYWSHYTPAGNPPWVFVSAVNYQYDKIGENLAAGFSDAQSTINGWMASTEHRENMLDKDFSQVGFGFANNPNYTSAGSGGPMTIVVAFYGEPVQATSALDKASSVALASAGNNLSSGPPAATSRAQLAMSGLPLAAYASAVVGFGLMAVVVLWVNRHICSLKLMARRGERYAATHLAIDIGTVALLIFIFLGLSKTAGFTL